jgi:hypothetical protein
VIRTGSLAPTFAAILFAASTSAAQEHNTIAVGVGATHRMSPDGSARGDDSIGVKLRLGHADSGWGLHYGLNWYSTNLDRDFDGRAMAFGELKLRPFLGGYGYTHKLTERVSLTGDVIGGFGFSSIELTQEADAALHVPPGTPVRVLTGTALVLKPEVSMWFDLTRKFGLSVDGGYIIARPSLSISSPLVNERTRIRADAFTISTGIVYRVY